MGGSTRATTHPTQTTRNPLWTKRHKIASTRTKPTKRKMVHTFATNKIDVQALFGNFLIFRPYSKPSPSHLRATFQPVSDLHQYPVVVCACFPCPVPVRILQSACFSVFPLLLLLPVFISTVFCCRGPVPAVCCVPCRCRAVCVCALSCVCCCVRVAAVLLPCSCLLCCP